MYCTTNAPFIEDITSITNSFTIEAQAAANSTWNSNRDNEYLYYGDLTVSENEVYNSYYQDLSTYVAENMLKFITGERSLDEWEDYIACLEVLGVAECISLKQAAYDRYIAR